MSIIEKAVDKMMGKLETPAPANPASMDAKDTAPPPEPDKEFDAAHAVAETAIEKDDSPVVTEKSGDPVTKPLQTSAAHVATPARPTGDAGVSAGNVLAIKALGLEGILSPDSERSRSAEEYRMIKRPLLTRAFGQNAIGEAHRNLIMVTSSVEGEGKTFSSLNLAISIAMEMDRTVLLVDADLAKPGLSRLLKVNNLPGLTDRLIDESLDLKDLLVKTDIPKFSILPAGRRHRRSTELLASSTMRHLLDELALRYSDRVILFDSPPLLATSEAGALAMQMGQICLVVESAVTPQYLVQDAVAQLNSTDNLSLILNKCKPDLFIGNYGYGYGNGYGYGYGYGYGNDDR